MIYIQFYDKSVICNTLIEASGDRSVVIVDGRLSSKNIGVIATRECRARDYLAWAVFEGESFTRSKRVSSIWPVDYSKHDKSASLAFYGA